MKRTSRQPLLLLIASVSSLAFLISCAPGAPPVPSAAPTATVVASKPSPPEFALVPYPAHLTIGEGTFAVSASTPVLFNRRDTDSAGAANYLLALLHRSPGLALKSRARGGGAISFVHLTDGAATGKEGYRISITPKGVTVAASQSAGLFYGAVTLWQLVTQAPSAVSKVRLPVVTIEDSPRFSWRGLMLDSVRHFQSVDFIKSLISAMAREKLNVLQWHLTDDQGWRLQIKKYPRLTQIAAFRVPAGEAALHDIDPRTHRPRLYGGFYTQAQVREIVAYAAARHITIVPELDMPGHAMAAIVAYPKLGSVAKPPQAISSDWGVFPYLYNVDDGTFRFLEDALTETMALFPSPYIHVGGDEAVKDQWKANASIQAKMHALGIANEDALQSWFIRRIERFLNAHGRRLIGWDEILEGGIPPKATITSWRGIDGAIIAAKSGHDAVLSPAPVLYLDNRQVEGSDEPSGRGKIVSLNDVYGFDPAIPALSADEQKHIIGVQANIWTEHIREEKNVAYAAFPRAAAVAELGWSLASAHDWPGFRARMGAELARYNALGVRHGTAGVIDVAPPAAPAFARDSHELNLCSAAISLSIEGPAPLKGKRPVYLHDVMYPCWFYPAVDLAGISKIEVSAGQLPFNFQIGSDVQKIALHPTATPDGELEVHVDGCAGPRIASLPMPHPGWNDGLTTVSGTITPQTGVHDLCLTFTRARLDPYWALHTVRLVKEQRP